MNIICITGKRGCGDALSEFTEKSHLPFNFMASPANYSQPVRHGIKLAHQHALNVAKKNGIDQSIIVEDDVELTSTRSLDYFIESAKVARECEYDIIVGGAHHYERTKRGAKKLSGMHFYMVLNPDVDFADCPKSEHIDNWVGRNYKVWVCSPMIAIQRPGWSEHRKIDVDYSELFGKYEVLR